MFTFCGDVLPPVFVSINQVRRMSCTARISKVWGYLPEIMTTRLCRSNLVCQKGLKSLSLTIVFVEYLCRYLSQVAAAIFILYCLHLPCSRSVLEFMKKLMQTTIKRTIMARRSSHLSLFSLLPPHDWIWNMSLSSSPPINSLSGGWGACLETGTPPRPVQIDNYIEDEMDDDCMREWDGWWLSSCRNIHT